MPAIEVVQNALQKRIFNRNGALIFKYSTYLAENPHVLRYIEHRTKQWDSLLPTIKDRIKILQQYKLTPDTCPVCGNIRFSHKKFCSVSCANTYQSRGIGRIRRPGTNKAKDAADDRRALRILLDGKPISWIETRERITSSAYFTRCNAIDSKNVEYFCFLDGRVVNERTYRALIGLEKLKSIPSPDPNYENMSAYRNRNRRGKTTIHPPKPIPEYKLTVGSAKGYYKLAYMYTNISLKLHNIPDIDKRSKHYHLDHIYSIRDGMANKIHPMIIGDAVNLRILGGKLNCGKGARSDMSKDELIRAFESHHNTKAPEFTHTDDLKIYFKKAKDGPVRFGYIRIGAFEVLNPEFETILMASVEMRKRGHTLKECSQFLTHSGYKCSWQQFRTFSNRFIEDHDGVADS